MDEQSNDGATIIEKFVKYVFTAEEWFKRNSGWSDFEKTLVFRRLHQLCHNDQLRWSSEYGTEMHLGFINSNAKWRLRNDLAITEHEKMGIYFDLIWHFYESTDFNERYFAQWAALCFPNSHEYIFNKVTSGFSMCFSAQRDVEAYYAEQFFPMWSF